jgi:hypothetical protein
VYIYQNVYIRVDQDLVELREPEVVPRRVAERAVDPVRPLFGQADELDPADAELRPGQAPRDAA